MISFNPTCLIECTPEVILAAFTPAVLKEIFWLKTNHCYCCRGFFFPVQSICTG